MHSPRLIYVYIFHAMNWYRKTFYGLNSQREPDEELMRLFETSANIDELKVVNFRRKCWTDYQNYRLDYSFHILAASSIEIMNNHSEKALTWLMKHDSLLLYDGEIKYIPYGFDPIVEIV